MKKKSLVGWIPENWRLNEWSDKTGQFNFNTIELREPSGGYYSATRGRKFVKVRITIEEIK